MSSQKGFILGGAPLKNIPDCSLGEYLFPKIRSLPQDLVIQVEADTGDVLTVRELLKMSVGLSEGLKRSGLKHNDVVGMMCKNCFEASEIVLGTWLSGAVIAPLDGGMKVAEMKHFLDLLQPRYLFCEEEALANATAALNQLSMSSAVIVVSKTKNLKTPHKTFQDVLVDVDLDKYNPQPSNSPSTRLAGILPSSGSSGLPKGVEILQRSLIFQDLNMSCLEGFGHKMDYLQISQFDWVTGILMFLRSLTSGMKIVLLREVTVQNILKAIEKYKTEWTLMAPLLAFSVANSPDFEKCDMSSLKLIAVGGSPFTRDIGEKVMGKWCHVKFIQSYGMTELSGIVCSGGNGVDVYSLGKVTPGVQVKVVNTSTGEALKSNSLGELCAKSPGLMRGYVGNEKATREAIDEDGWFHTGDLTYYDDSEQLFIVDRMKEMVKIMNKQVSPVEVESVILSVPGVLEVCVLAVSKDELSFELVGLVVKKKHSTVTTEDIYSQIESTLSEYKKPSRLYFVESLPKTSAGKLKRREAEKLARILHIQDAVTTK